MPYDPDWLSISLGLIAIAIACVAVILELHHSSQVKKHNIAEKTAMIWNYAEQFSQQPSEYRFYRIMADLNA
jgi:hypothetical protein